MTEIPLEGHRITTSHNVTCLGVAIDAELTFATHVKRVASRCFYQLRQLWSVRPALSVDNARMLAHAFIASRIDYCNSILYQTAAVHLRPLQMVLNAAARLVVKKRKCDSITLTIRDNLHWLLVRQRVDLYTGVQVSSPARRSVPRVDDQSGLGSLYMSPLALGRSR